MNTLEKFEAGQLAKLQAENEIPEFAPGDTVRVNVRVVEGERERTPGQEKQMQRWWRVEWMRIVRLRRLPAARRPPERPRAPPR